MPKVLHTTVVALTLSLVSAGATLGQQKSGYVDTELLLNRVPEYENVQQQLTLLSEDWRQELNKMQRHIDELKEEFRAKEILYTEELREEKKQQILQLEQQREQYLDQKFGPEGEYFQRQKELLEPIQRRIYEAISVVAQREGIDFVFDRSENAGLLYAGQQWNLNEEVLKELGLQTENPGN